MWLFYAWIFLMFNNNLIVGTFTTAVYGSYEHLL